MLISPKKSILGSLWVVFVTLVFIFFAYPIFELNAKIRVFLTTGDFGHRTFDEAGLPVSRSPKIGAFLSPFYVVHYGLQYSDYVKDKNSSYVGLHWREDPSHAKWNVPRDSAERASFESYFYEASNWLVENLSFQFGFAHYLYVFNWPYKGFPTDHLKAPWWSGLTDGYAILLLLRAYDHFGEERFLRTASSLYESVTSDIEKGGSMSVLRGSPWIEEYVDPRFAAREMSFVFNGMVYATYGIEAYEKYVDGGGKKIAQELYRSIFKNAALFDLRGWSSYDLLGSANNIKYHLIHASLIQDLNLRFPGFATKETLRLERDWVRTSRFPGFYYVLYGPKSIAYFHFLSMYVVFAFFPVFLFWLIVRFEMFRRRVV